MSNEPSQAIEWNEEGRISCEFSFKCPKMWDRLQSTGAEGVRHCSACDRDVHLALSEEDFRRHAEEGRCVAVRVLQSVRSLDGTEDMYVVGNVHSPYNSRLEPR